METKVKADNDVKEINVRDKLIQVQPTAMSIRIETHGFGSPFALA